MKKLYLATVCFMPPVYAILLLFVFLRHLPFPLRAFPFLMAYFGIGFVVLLVDLWRSELGGEKKVLWTVVHLLVGGISLPAYWFFVVQRPSPPLRA